MVILMPAPGPVRMPLVRVNVVLDPAQESTETSALKVPPREVTVPVMLTPPVSDRVIVPPTTPGEIVPNVRGWTSVICAWPGGPPKCPGR